MRACARPHNLCLDNHYLNAEKASRALQQSVQRSNKSLKYVNVICQHASSIPTVHFASGV